MKQAGLDESPSDAADYLASTVPEIENADLRDTFLKRGPEAVEYLEANTEVRLQPVKTYPDYYPEKPGATVGGRVLEPVSFDGARLGANFGRLRPPLPEFTLFGGMMVNRLDIPHLRKFGRSFRSTLRSMRLVSQYALQRLRAPRGTTLHLGNALAARLYASLLARNVDIWFGASVEHLLVEGDAVRGVGIAGSAGSRPIVARKGVVLATGGFSHDQNFLGRYFPSAAGSVYAAPIRSFYLVCDRHFLWTYGLGRIRPFTLRLKRYVRSGELIEAPGIEALADLIGVERSALATTVERYNTHAQMGLDPEFGRGTTIYQRHLGDAGHRPNPCVAPIEQPPFYALRIYPADLATAIWLRTDCHARVLRNNGTVIAGLYACGNDMGSIMNGNYPGPGITLGPALTFGYIAGRHLAQTAPEARAQEKGQEQGREQGREKGQA